jgi:hypothetical protein
VWRHWRGCTNMCAVPLGNNKGALTLAVAAADAQQTTQCSVSQLGVAYAAGMLLGQDSRWMYLRRQAWP